jgi:CheY-like chemotaxis protein
VTDVVMPAMDGIRLVRALKAAPLLADIPVILTTGINVPWDLPVQALLRKPFSAAELTDLINTSPATFGSTPASVMIEPP